MRGSLVEQKSTKAHKVIGYGEITRCRTRGTTRVFLRKTFSRRALKTKKNLALEPVNAKNDARHIITSPVGR
jgi:hypothetical protein